VLAAGLGMLAPRKLIPAALTLGLAGVLVVAALQLRGIPVIQGVVLRSEAAGGNKVDLAVVQRLLEYQKVAEAFQSNPVMGAGPTDARSRPASDLPGEWRRPAPCGWRPPPRACGRDPPARTPPPHRTDPPHRRGQPCRTDPPCRLDRAWHAMPACWCRPSW